MFENEDALIAELDLAHAEMGRAQRSFLRLIAHGDRAEVWRHAGARDTAHWVAMRYGMSEWKARRWIAAAHALEDLPCVSGALERGELGIDKVVELVRFATGDDEARLIRWARDVSCASVRHRGDLEAKASIRDVREAERTRELSWWYHDEGRRFAMAVDLPAAQGPTITRALEREADKISALPGRPSSRRAGPMPW